MQRLRGALRGDALELQNGDCRTLALGGFAALGLGKPLLLTDSGDARQRLTDDWLETECYAVNNGSRLQLGKSILGTHVSTTTIESDNLERRCSKLLHGAHSLTELVV